MLNPKSLTFVVLTWGLLLPSWLAVSKPGNKAKTAVIKTAKQKNRGFDLSKYLRWGKVKLGFLGFINYEYTIQAGKTDNRFRLSRSYLTLEFKPVRWFESRATLDVHQNTAGDWDTRFKYIYAKFIAPVHTVAITMPNIEIGLVHVPWFDYEEHINLYRAEGPMFIERAGVLNSADVGFTVGGLLGEKLNKKYQEEVSSKYPGKYGSFAFGLYNGAGYHAKEKNKNKVFMSRLSIRPLGPVFPNLQVSYFFIYGKGNTPGTLTITPKTGKPFTVGAPKWMTHLIFLSVEHQYFTLTAQYAMGTGNQKGNKLDVNGNPLKFKGWSVFGEVKLPWITSSIIGRYDWWNWDMQGTVARFMAGAAYHFLKHSYVLLSFSRESHKNDPQWTAPKWGVQLSIQADF